MTKFAHRQIFLLTYLLTYLLSDKDYFSLIAIVKLYGRCLYRPTTSFTVRYSEQQKDTIIG